MREETTKAKGPWWHRFIIQMLCVLFGILVYWLLGFVVKDIGTMPGPDYKEILEVHVDQALVDKEKQLLKEIGEIDQDIEREKQIRTVLEDTSSNLQKTMGQLLDLKGQENQSSLTETQEQTLSQSLEGFLEYQERYQTINIKIATLMDSRIRLQNELEQVREEMKPQRDAAMQYYNEVRRRHSLWVAGAKLTFLLPLLLVAFIIVSKKRQSAYYLIYLAFAIAVLVKIGFVMHDHFPQRIFKYILILAALAGVLRLLIYFVRCLIAPKVQWLLKQYREGYERFLCPVCEFPIRRGPRRYLFWTRRSVKKHGVPNIDPGEEDVYTCPSCGTQLFHECEKCKEIRTTLLPYCEHCGSDKDV